MIIKMSCKPLKFAVMELLLIPACILIVMAVNSRYDEK